MNLPRCECTAFHHPDAKYCENCGAQPPRKAGTGRQESAPMSDEEASVFVAGCLVLGEALKATGGKWGVA
jgi:hypothetical protein